MDAYLAKTPQPRCKFTSRLYTNNNNSLYLVEKNLKLIRWVATSALSYNSFQTPTAKEFFESLNYDVPPEDDFSKLVTAAEVILFLLCAFSYANFCMKVICAKFLEKELASIVSVALTSDGWSDDRYRRYISLTAHWVSG